MTFSVLLVLNTSELLQNIFPFMGKLLLWCIVPCSFIPLSTLYGRYMNRDMPDWADRFVPSSGLPLTISYLFLSFLILFFGSDLKALVSPFLEELQPSSSVQAENDWYETDNLDKAYVWVTDSGKRYHAYPNCSNMKGPHRIHLYDAQDEGYTPCSKCNPPE